MANRGNVAEQVEQLSERQQDTIIRVGKRATMLQLIGGIPWLIKVVLGIWTMISPPAGLAYSDYDKLYLGLMIWLVIGAAWFIGIAVYVKVRYPYYSDAKWRYINNMRKRK